MLRPSEVLVLGLVITLIVWLDVPALLAPAFVVTIIGCSAYRWRCGRLPWPPPRDPQTDVTTRSFGGASNAYDGR